MSYNYATQRPYVFTEEGQEKLFAVMRFARKCIEIAGAVRSTELQRAAGGGDGWNLIALTDRLVELGMLREVTRDVCGQDRVFVAGSVPL